MYSCIHEGKVLDFHYKKCKEVPYIHTFYIGDILIGQIFKHGKHNWAAVSFHPNALGKLVSGFGNRYYASDYLLKINGFSK
jgi:hypothetical protein